MLHVRVRAGRGRETKYVRSNDKCKGARFDGGTNYSNPLHAAQSAPRFKLWLELGAPDWVGWRSTRE
jgi:hypothetical protein